MYPHDCYIQLTEETGYIGITLILSYILSLAFIKLKSRKNKNDIYLILLILFALALSNITEGLFYSKQIIYLFAIFYSISCNIHIKEKNNCA